MTLARALKGYDFVWIFVDWIISQHTFYYFQHDKKDKHMQNCASTQHYLTSQVLVSIIIDRESLLTF